MGAPETVRILDRLQALLGSWQGEQQLTQSPWMPGGSASASVSFLQTAGDRAVVQEQCSWRGGEVLLSGHGVLAALPESSDLLWFWFDSLGYVATQPGRVEWHGEAGAFERTSPRGLNRMLLELHGDELREHITFRPAGEAMFSTVATGIYRRA